jgi:DNA-binding NtrC family response regulator
VLFLDELGSMPIEHQAKLLRVIDDGEVLRVGDERARRVSVRFLAAINRPAPQLIREGTLREDLYYRLRGIEISLPPLCERSADVPDLARHFLGEGRPGFTQRALDALAAHAWPGNVRELRNAVQRALAFAGEERIDVRHLGFGEPAARGAPRAPESAEVRTLRQIEEEAIRKAYEACDGNQSLAARALGIDRSTLRRKLAAMNGLRPEETEPET